MKLRITFWRGVFLVILGAGAVATWVRFTRGFGASTNLSDEFPWGLWVWPSGATGLWASCWPSCKR